jgi:hypothetical protein
MALQLALLDAGWTVRTSPGEEFVFPARRARDMRPSAELMAVAAGQVSAEGWTARCRELGLEIVVQLTAQCFVGT